MTFIDRCFSVLHSCSAQFRTCITVGLIVCKSSLLCAGVRRCHIKMSPHEKSRPWKDNRWIDKLCRSLITISPAPGPISLPIIGSPLRKVSPGRQFTGKNPSHPGGRRAGGFLLVNYRPGTFLGDPKMMHCGAELDSELWLAVWPVVNRLEPTAHLISCFERLPRSNVKIARLEA